MSIPVGRPRRRRVVAEQAAAGVDRGLMAVEWRLDLRRSFSLYSDKLSRGRGLSPPVFHVLSYPASAALRKERSHGCHENNELRRCRQRHYYQQLTLVD